MKSKTTLYIAGIVALVLVGIGVTILRAKFQSDAYNRVLGREASTWWDALWVDLEIVRTTEAREP